MASTRPASPAVTPATALSTAILVSSGPTASSPTPRMDASSEPRVTPGCRQQAPISRRIQPGESTCAAGLGGVGGEAVDVLLGLVVVLDVAVGGLDCSFV